MFPSESDVLDSVTNDRFRFDNWAKHRSDIRYGGIPYPHSHEFAQLDGKRFTRAIVFSHFKESITKGVISAIKWGYVTHLFFEQ